MNWVLFHHFACPARAAITLVMLAAAPAGAAVQFVDQAVSAGLWASGESYGASWGDLDNTSEPVVEVTEARSKLKGFNVIPGDDASHSCLRLLAPEIAPVCYGPLKDRVWSDDVARETGLACLQIP